ncbi:hypothetical protein D1007_50977 [Hordeum vulgare]|nr:hypothetical protein D1007_50977 [Hordeum vulgare]
MPEVLERVTTIQSEILQLEDDVTVQSNENHRLKYAEGHNVKMVDPVEGIISPITFLNVVLDNHNIYEEIFSKAYS